MTAARKIGDQVYRDFAGPPQVLAERTIRFVLSDNSVDRMGDRIDAAGWQLSAFRLNPVVLWAHDSSTPPIGRARDLRVEGSRLIGDIEFASAADHPLADTVYRLVRGRFLNAVSVGFRPIDWAASTDRSRAGGIDFKRQELLEVSVVPVPANPNAIGLRELKGVNLKPLLPWARSLLAHELRTQHPNAPRLASARATLARLKGTAR